MPGLPLSAEEGKIQQKKRTNHAAIVHAHSFAASALCGMLAAIGAGTQPRLLDASGVADPAGIAVTFDDASLHTIPRTAGLAVFERQPSICFKTGRDPVACSAQYLRA